MFEWEGPVDAVSLPRLIARMDADRLRRYREYLDFYQGRQWETPARRRERRLTFNYARVLVEKVTPYPTQSCRRGGPAAHGRRARRPGRPPGPGGAAGRRSARGR